MSSVMELKHGFDLPRVKGHVDGLTTPSLPGTLEPDLHRVTILSSHKYQLCNPRRVR